MLNKWQPITWFHLEYSNSPHLLETIDYLFSVPVQQASLEAEFSRIKHTCCMHGFGTDVGTINDLN